VIEQASFPQYPHVISRDLDLKIITVQSQSPLLRVASQIYGNLSKRIPLSSIQVYVQLDGKSVTSQRDVKSLFGKASIHKELREDLSQSCPHLYTTFVRATHIVCVWNESGLSMNFDGKLARETYPYRIVN
jgi:hypothetical protein